MVLGYDAPEFSARCQGFVNPDTIRPRLDSFGPAGYSSPLEKIHATHWTTVRDSREGTK
jgi:hypothetical protein